jgi:hypothetical protein
LIFFKRIIHKYIIYNKKIKHMAKIKDNVSENTITNHANGELDENNKVMNWISQINVGGTIHDIATHHSIKFYDGSNDTEGVVWNGLTDIEVVIPSITDIVNTPVVFAGTVGKDGKIVWTPEYTFASEETVPEAGYLVFITEDCTFNGSVCEAGDMAIYDGANWKIVTGENQVSIVGNNGEEKTTIAIGPAKDVLVVEGKTLALTLDYTDLDKHLSLTGGKVEIVSGNITVDEKYISLTKGTETATIGDVKTIKEATALADGTVTLVNAENLVNGVDFGTFDGGKLPVFSKNSQKDLTVSGGLLKTTTTEEFVKTVVIGDVNFTTADANDANKIEVVTGISSAADGNVYFNEIRKTKVDENEAADFTIPGQITLGDNNIFVTGLEGGINEVVTSITEGEFNLVDGDEIVTGLSDIEDSDDVADVISSVSLTADNNTSVLNKASVKNHVLEFGSTNVTSGVSLDYTGKMFTKSAISYKAPSATTTAFTTSAISYETSNAINYTFGRGKETTYTTQTSMYKIVKPEITLTKGGYEIDHTNMIATVSADMFIASVEEGTLPTWTGGSVSKVTVTGNVGTALTTNDVTFNALKSNDIDLPTYALSEDANSGTVAIAVAGEYGYSSELDLTGYITDVEITETEQPQQ